MTDFENETWLIDVGHEIITEKHESPKKHLKPLQRLIECLWVADYGMRNAGDIATAFDLDSNFHSDGRRLAGELLLPRCTELFARDPAAFESDYFVLFDNVCVELKSQFD